VKQTRGSPSCVVAITSGTTRRPDDTRAHQGARDIHGCFRREGAERGAVECEGAARTRAAALQGTTVPRQVPGVQQLLFRAGLVRSVARCRKHNAQRAARLQSPDHRAPASGGSARHRRVAVRTPRRWQAYIRRGSIPARVLPAAETQLGICAPDGGVVTVACAVEVEAQLISLLRFRVQDANAGHSPALARCDSTHACVV